MVTSKTSAMEIQGMVEVKGVAGEVPEVIMGNEVVRVEVTMGSVVVRLELTM